MYNTYSLVITSSDSNDFITWSLQSVDSKVRFKQITATCMSNGKYKYEGTGDKLVLLDDTKKPIGQGSKRELNTTYLITREDLIGTGKILCLGSEGLVYAQIGTLAPVYVDVPKQLSLYTNQLSARTWVKSGGKPLLSYFSQLPANSQLSFILSSFSPETTLIVPSVGCTPNCTNKTCSQLDGCGKVCGCPSGQECINNECVPTDPCSTCGWWQVCFNGQCTVNWLYIFFIISGILLIIVLFIIGWMLWTSRSSGTTITTTNLYSVDEPIIGKE